MFHEEPKRSTVPIAVEIVSSENWSFDLEHEESLFGRQRVALESSDN